MWVWFIEASFPTFVTVSKSHFSCWSFLLCCCPFCFSVHFTVSFMLLTFQGPSLFSPFLISFICYFILNFMLHLSLTCFSFLKHSLLFCSMFWFLVLAGSLVALISFKCASFCAVPCCCYYICFLLALWAGVWKSRRFNKIVYKARRLIQASRHSDLMTGTRETQIMHESVSSHSQ